MAEDQCSKINLILVFYSQFCFRRFNIHFTTYGMHRPASTFSWSIDILVLVNVDSMDGKDIIDTHHCGQHRIISLVFDFNHWDIFIIKYWKCDKYQRRTQHDSCQYQVRARLNYINLRMHFNNFAQTWVGWSLISTKKISKIFPKHVVKNQNDPTTDFMDFGA